MVLAPIGSLAGYVLLVTPKVETFDVSAARVVNPIRTYRFGLVLVEEIASSRRSYPRAVVSGYRITLVALEQPLMESIADSSEDTAERRGHQRSRRTRLQQPDAVDDLVDHPRRWWMLLIAAWAGYAIPFIFQRAIARSTDGRSAARVGVERRGPG